MRSRRAGIITKLIISALAVYAVVSLIRIQGRIEDAEQSRDALAGQVHTIQNENASLAYKVEHSTDRETIEDIARSKLGLVLPGEIVFYDLGG